MTFGIARVRWQTTTANPTCSSAFSQKYSPQSFMTFYCQSSVLILNQQADCVWFNCSFFSGSAPPCQMDGTRVSPWRTFHNTKWHVELRHCHLGGDHVWSLAISGPEQWTGGGENTCRANPWYAIGLHKRTVRLHACIEMQRDYQEDSTQN